MSKPVTPISSRTRRRLTGEERKASFLEAAARLIRERGLEGLTMEGVAAWCGVNKALPYRYFANRDDLLVALYAEENRTFDERLAEATEHLEGFEAKLRALVGTWYAGVRQASGTPELMQARTQSGELEAQRKARMLVAANYIADLIQESYDIRREQAKLAANVLLAGSQGLAGFWRLPGMDHEGLTESFIVMSIGAVEAIARRL